MDQDKITFLCMSYDGSDTTHMITHIHGLHLTQMVTVCLSLGNKTTWLGLGKDGGVRVRVRGHKHVGYLVKLSHLN